MAVHRAVCVAQGGGRVVLVGERPQGNASWWPSGGRRELGMGWVLGGDNYAEDVVRMGKRNVALVPGDDSTGDARTMFAGVAKLKEISEKLAPIGRKAEGLFIDMMPSRSAG